MNGIDMADLDIVVQFSKLWGIETSDARSNKEKYLEMEAYDSSELLQMFIAWKSEYISDDNADDTVDFFYKKFKALSFNRT